MMLGMSQKKLGDALGLTFQQVPKYPRRGSNRDWRERRLQQISLILPACRPAAATRRPALLAASSKGSTDADRQSPRTTGTASALARLPPNSIENVMGTVRRVCRNVKRWRNASMALRWTAAGMMEATKGFRRLKAHKQLPILKAALAARQAKHTTQQKLEENLQAA